jgi:hypothetical protein
MSLPQVVAEEEQKAAVQEVRRWPEMRAAVPGHSRLACQAQAAAEPPAVVLLR